MFSMCLISTEESGCDAMFESGQLQTRGVWRTKPRFVKNSDGETDTPMREASSFGRGWTPLSLSSEKRK